MPLSDNLRGALFMCASMAGFGINDGFMKLVFADLPLAQSIAVRGAFATIILALFAWRTGALRTALTRQDRRGLSLRTVAEICATGTFLVAISQLPIADATAVLQAAPLAVTMAAALFMGERVRWRRWSAIGVGFVGVIIMVRPGTDAFTAWSMLPVVTVVFITMRDLITRTMRAGLPSALVSAITALAITLAAAVLMPLEGMVAMSLADVGLLAAAAGFLVIGYFFSVAAMRVGDVSAVSPFRYTVLLWAILVGFVFFGDVPDLFTITGASLVTVAGLYTLWREQVVDRGRPAALSPVHGHDAPRLSAGPPPVGSAPAAPPTAPRGPPRSTR